MLYGLEPKAGIVRHMVSFAVLLPRKLNVGLRETL